MSQLLLVDDEVVTRYVTAITLRRLGYTVTETDRLETALASPLPDVAVLDVMMPRVNGFSFAAALRQRVPDLPIVFFTGSPTTAVLAQAQALGNCMVLPKPALPEELQDALDAVMGSRSAK